MRCGTEAASKIDCDGIADNGCETKPTTNDDCGGCGVKCADPEHSCLYTAGISMNVPTG